MLDLTFILGRCWAVTPEIAVLGRTLISTDGIARLRRLSEFHAAVGAAGTGRPASRSGTVAVIPIIGMVTQRGDIMDSARTTSTDGVAATVRAFTADATIDSIVLEIDSPGGEVYGVTEACMAIRDARSVKPVVASVNSLCASAAYWMGSQAEEVIGTPSGEMGSIGVYAAHQDVSKALEAEGVKVTLISAGKYKVEGSPYEPLSDEALANIQSGVNRYYDIFTKDVARGRGVSVDTVRNCFGEGRVVGAKAAVEQGMANSVGTLDDAIRRAAQLGRERKRGMAALASAQATLGSL
jgi:signal peptide peptidase SppA